MTKMKSEQAFQKQFPFKIDEKLKHKLLRLASTLDKRDVWILIDGDEGSGKTNSAAYLLYFFHCLLGRQITLDRLYFDSEPMFEWAKDNSNGLICWDEAALGGLSTEWWSEAQRNLLKFAMVGRKKHHIFVMCIPRFNKLKEDLRTDRIHALIHMDLGKKANKYGHFIYLPRRAIKKLNRIWSKKKVRAYSSCVKYGGFYSNIDIPNVFGQVFNEEEYEKKKDQAISDIGKGKTLDKNSDKLQLKELKRRIASMQLPIQTQTDLAKQLGYARPTIKEWGISYTKNEDMPSKMGQNVVEEVNNKD